MIGSNTSVIFSIQGVSWARIYTSELLYLHVLIDLPKTIHRSCSLPSNNAHVWPFYVYIYTYILYHELPLTLRERGVAHYTCLLVSKYVSCHYALGVFVLLCFHSQKSFCATCWFSQNWSHISWCPWSNVIFYPWLPHSSVQLEDKISSLTDLNT